MSDEPLTHAQLTELLRYAHNFEATDVIGDLGAMMGQCAQMGSGRTIADTNGRYQPKTELGKHIQATVDREMARIRAERQARRVEPSA